MISQLSLFDTSVAEVGSFYKPGDWVKIKKVPAIAKHVRCGHVYKIHAVDPTDGKLQFWNPFARQWDLLYPDEVKLALVLDTFDDSVTAAEVAVTESKSEPVIDSVTAAEVAVTESSCQHSETYTIHPVGAVTESNCPHSEIDSVTAVEVAVTESTPEPAIDYFSAVSAYKPRGTARGKEYFRLSYKVGRKVRHCHIRGGNTDSPIAQAKVAEVRSLLAAGIAPAEIAAMLKTPKL